MFFDGNGEAVDWILGFRVSADVYREKVQAILKGIGTFRSLTQVFARNPESVESAFKLGQKYADKLDRAKADEFYQKVIALDPEGKKGETEYNGEKTSYTQSAEFGLAASVLSARPPDRAPMLAFIKKYPGGKIVEDAYSQLSRAHYRRTAAKEEAAAFYADYTGRFPDSIAALSAWVQRILQDKEPVDKGIELALKALQILKTPAPEGSIPSTPLSMNLNLARFYYLKGEKGKAVETIDAAFKSDGADVSMVPSIAQAYAEIEAADKALAVFGPEFLKNNGGDAEALRAYAAFWTDQEKNLPSALEAAKKMIELGSAAPTSWLMVANVYLKLKNGAEAVKAAEKALAVAPEYQKANTRRQVDQIKTQAAEIK